MQNSYDPLYVQELAADAVLGLWLFCLGGVVGSFLNVLVYRRPLGMSLLRPRSRCPACGHPIRSRDNIPMLGWLLLGGRCRDCDAPISPRYPLVELATALIFFAPAVPEIFLRGANLPLAEWAWADNAAGMIPRQIELLATYIYHVTLLLFLLVTGLLRFDRRGLPLDLAVATLAVGLLLPLWVPGVRPVPSVPVDYFAGAWRWVRGLCDGLAGAAVAASIAAASRRLMILHFPGAGRRRFAGVVAATSVGLFLGWQAGICLLAATTSLFWLARAPRRPRAGARRLPWTIWLCLATLAWIVWWRRLVEISVWWPW